MLTSKQTPRRFKVVLDQGGADSPGAAQGGRAAVTPEPSRRSVHIKPNSVSETAAGQPDQLRAVVGREIQRSHDKSVSRWMVLVRRFNLLVDFLHPRTKNFTLSVLDGRISEIETLRLDAISPTALYSTLQPDRGLLRELSEQKK